jgi:hypothetical protein
VCSINDLQHVSTMNDGASIERFRARAPARNARVA